MNKKLLIKSSFLFLPLFFSIPVKAIDWGQTNDPGNISANSGTTFTNVGTWASYDGNCGPDAYLKTSGGCNIVNEEDETGWCWGTASVSANITMNAGGTTACIITFSANNSSSQDREKKSTIKVNQLISWIDVPNKDISISDGFFRIDAQGTTADANINDRIVTATIAATTISFTSQTPSICSITEFGRVNPLLEGTCMIQANVGGDEHLMPVSDTYHWDQFFPDTDKDGHKDNVDICPNDFDPAQTDTDGSGIGDACNTADDPDGDEYEYSRDNCPTVNNPDQKDSDKSGIGNACNNDIDIDNDEWENTRDNCESIYNPGDTSTGKQVDSDGDGLGDACDIDTDLDTILDAYDNCPQVANKDQEDANDDGIGDACAVDGDSDGIDDQLDNCPLIANPAQLDSNKNGLGDVCEIDTDKDGIPDDSGAQKDNCPLIKNADQADSDLNGRGDACEVAFVTTSGNDENDCLSWSNACKTLQGGIDAAVLNNLPQVFVKMGAYKPATSINLKAGIRVIGGFEGKAEETRSTDANSSSNLTLITADSEYPNGDTLTDGITSTVAAKAKADNRGTLLSAIDLPAGSANRVTLMGFTINASQNSALVVDNADVELINVRFIANQADDGAAIKAINGASVKINNVIFSNNQASTSAVLHLGGSHLSATRSTFEYNHGASGSAIFADGQSVIGLDLSHFGQNVSAGNGSIHAAGDEVKLNVGNSTFSSNTAANGGAIYIEKASAFVVTNTLFENNHTSSGRGGALVLAGAAATDIRQSSFIGNTAFGNGGAVVVVSGSSVAIENSTFANNKAGANADGSASGQQGKGGAVDATGSNVAVFVTSSTLAVNNAAAEGGALAIDSQATGSLNLSANLITGNTAVSGNNVAITGGAHNNRVVDGGYNLFGFNGLSGLLPESAIDFASSSSITGTSTLVTDILEVVPTLKGGDGYDSSVPLLPIIKASEARNVIPKASCPTNTDQRDEVRADSDDAFCDIGAYEYTVLSCIDEVQRRQENGERVIKFCGSGLEGIEFSVGQVHWYMLILLSLFGLGLNFRRR